MQIKALRSKKNYIVTFVQKQAIFWSSFYLSLNVFRQENTKNVKFMKVLHVLACHVRRNFLTNNARLEILHFTKQIAFDNLKLCYSSILYANL